MSKGSRECRKLAATLVLAIVALASATRAEAKSNSCRFQSAPIQVVREGGWSQPDSRLLMYWDVKQPQVLWSTTAPAPRSYRRYLSQVRTVGFETDPLAALRASPSVNNAIVLSASSEWIRPANCLEKLLIGLQNNRVNITRDPTEFVSVVLDRPDTERIRVYFYSVNRNGIGAMTPLTRLIDADVTQGWQVNFVLHNHAFHLADPALNGILAPSGPDAHFNLNFLASHGLRQARITNGLYSVEVPSNAFSRFDHE